MQAEDETKVVDRESKLAALDPPSGSPSEPVEREASGSLELLSSPRVVGRYELIHRLGHGGMATVYVGRATGTAGFERLVAVKLIHPHLANEPEFVEMFLDEARIAAKIHHPNVVETIDLGEDGDQFFMVMEYVEGDTLASLLRQLQKGQRRVPLAVALQITIDICKGLAAAHDLVDRDGSELRLVHRDVSPHNLLVTMDGRVQVVDFGIMKAAGKPSNTLTGQLRGKVAYMSPEQARGLPVDLRADIFAVGAVLWEMCAGERLYPGSSASGVLDKVLRCDIGSIRDVQPELPAELDDILARALGPLRKHRYACALDMVADLKLLLRKIQGDDEPQDLLAEIMHATFSGRVDYIKATIRGHAANGLRGSTGRPSDSGLGRDLSRTTPLGAVASLVPASGPATQTSTLSATLTAPARSWLLWLLLPLAGAAIGTAIVGAGRSGGEPAPVVKAIVPAPMASPTPEAAAAPRPSVEIPAVPQMAAWRFQTDPPGAEVFVAGESVGRAPLSTKVLKGTELLDVWFELDGYQLHKMRLAPETAHHSITLTALPKKKKPWVRARPPRIRGEVKKVVRPPGSMELAPVPDFKHAKHRPLGQ